MSIGKMKKDYRRETQEIIKNLNLSDDELSRKIEVTSRTIYRWRKGIGSPHASQFQRLKAIADGTISGIGSNKEGSDNMIAEVLKTLGAMQEILKRMEERQEQYFRIGGRNIRSSKKAKGATGTDGI